MEFKENEKYKALYNRHNDDKMRTKFNALRDVLRTAAEDRDYVLWNRDTENPFETSDGGTLKAFDPVLVLDWHGSPNTFMMFTGEYEETDEWIRPVFMCSGEESVRTYKPAVSIK